MTALMTPAPIERPSTAGRDPAHALYEHAGGLLASAQSLGAAARAPGAVAALAPTLACVETSLTTLARAIGQLRYWALEGLVDLPHEDVRGMAVTLERLAGVLEQGSAASEEARRSIAPVHGELRAL
jgi:hypothetical protein